MGEVVKFAGGGAVVDLKSLSGSLKNVVSYSEPLATGEPILRLLRDGLWVYGQESIEVQEGAVVAFNPTSVEHGYISWGDAEILGEVMVPLNQQRPPRASLQDTGASWDEQFAIRGIIMSGEDEGTELIYKPTSLGGRRAFHELMSQILQRIDAGEAPVPMVVLETDHYMHKKYGKIYTPVLRVTQWASLAGEVEDSPEPEVVATPAEPAAAEEKGPKRRQRRKRVS